jgi:NADH:ubiquinone oxidoreductase subunit 6 (subunit J)
MLIVGAEFIAMLLVIVYVGAVAVLFLFVVMMLDVDFAELRAGFAKYLPFGGLLALVLLAEIVFAVAAWNAGGHRDGGEGGSDRSEHAQHPGARHRSSTRATSTSSRRPGSSSWSR